jgi:hypothetical protein
MERELSAARARIENNCHACQEFFGAEYRVE